MCDIAFNINNRLSMLPARVLKKLRYHIIPKLKIVSYSLSTESYGLSFDHFEKETFSITLKSGELADKFKSLISGYSK